MDGRVNFPCLWYIQVFKRQLGEWRLAQAVDTDDDDSSDDDRLQSAADARHATLSSEYRKVK